MIVRQERPDQPKILQLLESHLRDMHRHSPADSVHALDVSSLLAPEITFWAAWDGEQLLGCGALKEHSSVLAEIKSMRTWEDHRGSGVGANILQAIVAHAIAHGYVELSLETGSADVFSAARSLYSKYGFDYCEPFADYAHDPYSVFMTRVL